MSLLFLTVSNQLNVGFQKPLCLPFEMRVLEVFLFQQRSRAGQKMDQKRLKYLTPHRGLKWHQKPTQVSEYSQYEHVEMTYVSQ